MKKSITFFAIILLSFAFSCNDDDTITDQLNGTWFLNELKDRPDLLLLSRLPDLTITNNSNFGGFGGCNSYTAGEIGLLTNTEIRLGGFISTDMWCSDENIETSYFPMLAEVRFYEITDGNKLFFFDANRVQLARFGRQ